MVGDGFFICKRAIDEISFDSTVTDHKDMMLREQLERIKSAEETNADYENTIAQFRELVGNLQKYVPFVNLSFQLVMIASKLLTRNSSVT